MIPRYFTQTAFKDCLQTCFSCSPYTAEENHPTTFLDVSCDLSGPGRGARFGGGCHGDKSVQSPSGSQKSRVWSHLSLGICLDSGMTGVLWKILFYSW